MQGEIARLLDESPGLRAAPAKEGAVAAMRGAVGVAGLAAALARGKTQRRAQPLHGAAGERRAVSG